MIEKLREELIKDILTYLDKSVPAHLSDENNEVHTTITQIIVDTFDDYELKVKEWGRLPDHDESTVEDSMVQEAKFELLKYRMKGKNYPDNGEYGYALTEYLVKLVDADGEEVMYNITDYYNDSEEIIHTKIWRLQKEVSVEYDNEIKVDSRLGKKILTFVTNEHPYRSDTLEAMYVKEMEDKIDSHYEK